MHFYGLETGERVVLMKAQEICTQAKVYYPFSIEKFVDGHIRDRILKEYPPYLKQICAPTSEIL
jgi:hypothetical protein